MVWVVWKYVPASSIQDYRMIQIQAPLTLRQEPNFYVCTRSGGAESYFLYSCSIVCSLYALTGKELRQRSRVANPGIPGDTCVGARSRCRIHMAGEYDYRFVFSPYPLAGFRTASYLCINCVQVRNWFRRLVLRIHTYMRTNHTWPLAKSLEPRNGTDSAPYSACFNFQVRNSRVQWHWQWLILCGEQPYSTSTISGSVLRNPVVPCLPTRQFELPSPRLIRSLRT
jgi:hypothetical protein